MTVGPELHTVLGTIPYDMYNALMMVAGAAMVTLGVVAHNRRNCTCEKCGFHVNEARLNREKDRARRHRALHAGYALKWGSPNCPDCRSGHEDDRP